MSAQLPCAGSREIQLAAGETLIREGELGDTAYCIVSGEVRVWKRGGAGEIELARLGPGATFGEMSIVDEKPRSASITTLCDTRLKDLKRAQFLDSFQHDPDFATSLLRVLFERLRETGAKLTELQQGPALRRLRRWKVPWWIRRLRWWCAWRGSPSLAARRCLAIPL